VLLALLYALLRLLIDLLIIRGRPTADRDLELLVLRQELLVLQRSARRPRWRRADRMILAALGRQLPASDLLLAQPATILGWHRAQVRRRWSAFGRRPGPGRVPLHALRHLTVTSRNRSSNPGYPPPARGSLGLPNTAPPCDVASTPQVPGWQLARKHTFGL